MLTLQQRRAPKREIFLRYWLPLVLYVSVIFLLSSLPLGDTLQKIEIPDKVIHATEYLLLPILFFRFLLFAFPRNFAKYYFFLGMVLAAGIGAADELYQSHVPGRTMDFYDFLADVTGISIAAAGWFIWRQFRKRK